MNKIRFYQIVIAALLILNIVLLFLHLNRPNRPPRPRDIIIEKLHFDKTQIAQYEALVNVQKEIQQINVTKINEAKNSLYQQLNQPKDSLKVDSLLNNITDLQKTMVMKNFKHFQDIKKICKPEQLPDFKKLVGELNMLFSGPRPPRKPE